MSFYPYEYHTIWDDEDLITTFEKEVVDKELLQDWAQEEMQHGSTRGEIEDLIWADYEIWALDYLIQKKDAAREAYYDN